MHIFSCFPCTNCKWRIYVSALAVSPAWSWRPNKHLHVMMLHNCEQVNIYRLRLWSEITINRDGIYGSDRPGIHSIQVWKISSFLELIEFHAAGHSLIRDTLVTCEIIFWSGLVQICQRGPCPYKALFGCSRIHLNPCVSEWIGMENSLRSTPIHSNVYRLRWIRVHPNKP